MPQTQYELAQTLAQKWFLAERAFEEHASVLRQPQNINSFLQAREDYEALNPPAMGFVPATKEERDRCVRDCENILKEKQNCTSLSE